MAGRHGLRGRVAGSETRGVGRGQSRRDVLQTTMCYRKALERFEQGKDMIWFLF